MRRNRILYIFLLFLLSMCSEFLQAQSLQVALSPGSKVNRTTSGGAATIFFDSSIEDLSIVCTEEDPNESVVKINDYQWFVNIDVNKDIETDGVCYRNYLLKCSASAEYFLTTGEITPNQVLYYTITLPNELEPRLKIEKAKRVVTKANELIENGDSYSAKILLLEQLKKDSLYFPELECCFRKANDLNSAILYPNEDCWAISFSKDDLYIASGTTSGQIKIWDTNSGTIIHDWQGHSKRISSISFNPDKSEFISVSDDNLIKIWNINNWSLKRVLTGHCDYVYSALYDKEGRKIISASADSTIRIWDATTGDIQHIYKEETSFVRYAEFSPNGKAFLEVSTDSFIRIRNVKSGKIVKILKGHKRSIESAKYSSSGKYIISSSYGNIRIWDTTTYTESKSFMLDDIGHITDAIFTPNEKYIIAYSYIDNRIMVINPENGQVDKNLEKHTEGVYEISISNNGKRIVSASSDQTIRIWDLEVGNNVKLKNEEAIFDILYSNEGTKIITRTYLDKNDNGSGHIGLWDSSNGNLIKYLFDVKDCTGEMAISPDNRFLALSVDIWRDTPVLLYDLKKEVLVHEIGGKDITSLAFSPDCSKLIISSRTQDSIEVWDVKSASLLKSMDISNIHSDFVNFVCYSHDNEIIISSSRDGTIGLFSSHDYTFMKLLKGHSKPVLECISNKDNTLAYSASADKTVKIWNTQTGECIKTLSHENVVNTISLSPNEEWLVSGSDDNIVRIWNTTTGDLVYLLDMGDDINKVEFSPDGRHFYVLKSHDDILILDFPSYNTIIKNMRDHFKKRQLTLEERIKYDLE